MQRKLACVVFLTVSLGCASGERRSQPARLPSPTPTVAATVSTPVTGEAAQVIKEGSGKFNQYKFSYKRLGDQVEAAFKSPRLPRNDAVVVAAAREIIIAAYEDKSENFPRPILWHYQGAEVNAIYLEADNYEYVFVPVKAGVGEIGSLLFWKLKKGTTRR